MLNGIGTLDDPEPELNMRPNDHTQAPTVQNDLSALDNYGIHMGFIEANQPSSSCNNDPFNFDLFLTTSGRPRSQSPRERPLTHSAQNMSSRSNAEPVQSSLGTETKQDCGAEPFVYPAEWLDKLYPSSSTQQSFFPDLAPCSLSFDHSFKNEGPNEATASTPLSGRSGSDHIDRRQPDRAEFDGNMLPDNLCSRPLDTAGDGAGLQWEMAGGFSQNSSPLSLKSPHNHDRTRVGPSGAQLCDQMTAEKFDGSRFIDSHCHLDFMFDKLRNPPKQGDIMDWYRAKTSPWSPAFGGCVANWCHPSTYMAEGCADDPLNWANIIKHRSVVGAVFGLHPHFAEDWGDTVQELLMRRLDEPKCIAVGETGLDYSHKNKVPRYVQEASFVSQINLAAAFQKTLLVHCRNGGSHCDRGVAEDQLLDILKQNADKSQHIHRHCYTLGPEPAARLMAEFPHIYFGLTPALVGTLPRDQLRQFVVDVPLDRLLVETDAPYFDKSKHKFNHLGHSHPGFAIEVALEIAAIKSLPVPQVIEKLTENTNTCYRQTALLS